MKTFTSAFFFMNERRAISLYEEYGFAKHAHNKISKCDGTA